MDRKFKFQIITPKGIILQDEAVAVSAPAVDGEITILYNHVPLFCLLKEGVLKVKKQNDELYFSIGGGYLETTGKEVNLLVSRAYGQDEIDEEAVKKAKEEAEKRLLESKSEIDRRQALASLRRSLVDLKLLKIRQRKRSGQHQ